MTEYSLVVHNQSFEAMETIAGIEEYPGCGHSFSYISTIFPVLGLLLYAEDGVKKFFKISVNMYDATRHHI